MNDFDTKWIKWIFKRRQFSGSFRTKADWCAKQFEFLFENKKEETQKKTFENFRWTEKRRNWHQTLGTHINRFFERIYYMLGINRPTLGMDVDVYLTRWETARFARVCASVFTYCPHMYHQRCINCKTW